MTIEKDVLAMKQVLKDVSFFGPYIYMDKEGVHIVEEGLVLKGGVS